MRLAIVASHPIQYQAPMFRELAKNIELQVFFACRDRPEDQAKAGFGVAFSWDRDLTSGYRNSFLCNRARFPAFDRFFGCNTPEIFDIVARKELDVMLVMGWNLFSYWQAIAACRLAKVPLMVRGDSHLDTKRSGFTRATKRLLYGAMLQTFDRCLYVGTKSKDYYEHYGVAPEKLFYSPHSVENAWFEGEMCKQNKNELRRKLGVSEDAFVPIFVGKLVKDKRPADVIDAVAAIGGDCEIVYVGAGDQESHIVRRAGDKGVKVHLLGFKNQTEMPGCYSLADALVVPSQSETWGLVVNEAMACGLPVVASDAVGCSVDLIEQKVTGYVYPVGDIDGLTFAMKKIIESGCGESLAMSIKNKVGRHTPADSAHGILTACQSI